VERCRAGDQEAARQLFEIYVNWLIPLAQQRLSARVRDGTLVSVADDGPLSAPTPTPSPPLRSTSAS
jgi:hypothetical protein